MTKTNHRLPINGTVAADSSGPFLVLSERLEGHDTFLTGQLQLYDALPVQVQILTFDDVTVLRLLDPSQTPPTGPWAGILHLPRGWRARPIPDDLMAAVLIARRDLAVLDEAERRYALTFLGEASTSAIRQARIDAIVTALPAAEGTA
ncbi:hypothetical protein [Micromonospora sp. WMMD1082]|uniref:hypothetical protein n=1 Tax=Micromonospora sp. WMMD1082 TaxID=3016104 RepID=UPI00241670BA|nr:hypothetical protein [Micromonospora sp. WMMD1082]MDG4793482.1 hypothetical protein [Micromonospora sp. WMMD1082]